MALRCHHEMGQYETASTFATFTYDDAHLPAYGSLVPHHYTDFIKRLRRSIAPRKVRYFQCGEYGDKFERPHHHAILFGYEPPDEILAGYSNKEPIYSSEFLTERWSHGQVITGRATFQSAAYVARYITKKVNGELAEDHYTRDCPYTGQTYSVVPEYATMSTRPGIGKAHLEQWMSDIFPSDEVIFEGRVHKPPRYYSDHYRSLEPDSWDAIRKKRKQNQVRHKKDQTPERLRQRETVKKAQYAQLKRGYENET